MIHHWQQSPTLVFHAESPQTCSASLLLYISSAYPPSLSAWGTQSLYSLLALHLPCFLSPSSFFLLFTFLRSGRVLISFCPRRAAGSFSRGARPYVSRIGGSPRTRSISPRCRVTPSSLLQAFDSRSQSALLSTLSPFFRCIFVLTCFYYSPHCLNQILHSGLRSNPLNSADLLHCHCSPSSVSDVHLSPEHGRDGLFSFRHYRGP